MRGSPAAFAPRGRGQRRADHGPVVGGDPRPQVGHAVAAWAASDPTVRPSATVSDVGAVGVRFDHRALEVAAEQSGASPRCARKDRGFDRDGLLVRQADGGRGDERGARQVEPPGRQGCGGPRAWGVEHHRGGQIAGRLRAVVAQTQRDLVVGELADPVPSPGAGRREGRGRGQPAGGGAGLQGAPSGHELELLSGIQRARIEGVERRPEHRWRDGSVRAPGKRLHARQREVVDVDADADAERTGAVRVHEDLSDGTGQRTAPHQGNLSARDRSDPRTVRLTELSGTRPGPRQHEARCHRMRRRCSPPGDGHPLPSGSTNLRQGSDNRPAPDAARPARSERRPGTGVVEWMHAC